MPNRPAILSALDGLIDGLSAMRNVVDGNERAELHRRLVTAREAHADLRRGSPAHRTWPSCGSPSRTARGPPPMFALAAELGVNIDSFEVVHSTEGNHGVAVVLVDAGRRRRCTAAD